MNPPALLVDLRRRGVELTADGSALRYRAARGVLTPADLEALRTNKAELIEALAGVTSPDQRGLIAADEGALIGADDGSSLSPFERLQIEWTAAHSKALETFSEHSGVNPSEGTLEATTWLQMEVDRGWADRRGMDEALARSLLKELYAGRLVGRIGPQGRPLLWTARRDPAAVFH